MAAVSGDDPENKMEGLSLADKKTLSAKKKSRFTRHDKDCAHTIKLWEDDPEDRALGDRARKQLVTVREDYEAAMQVYESIEGSQGITEEFFSKNLQIQDSGIGTKNPQP